nr:unnamed protein product [Digitaria exilis]
MRSLAVAGPHPGAAFAAHRRCLHPSAADRSLLSSSPLLPFSTHRLLVSSLYHAASHRSSHLHAAVVSALIPPNSISQRCWKCEKTQNGSFGSSLRITHLPGLLHRDVSKILLPPTAAVSVEQAEATADLPKGDMWSVHKFGGTCMGTSQRIQNVADIVLRDPSERKLVVVSAMSKVTDMMYNLVNKAQSRDDSYITALDEVFEKHMRTAKDLLAGDDLARVLSQLHADITGHATESFSDFVVGHGELCWMDTREVLVVNPSGSNQVDPDYLESEKRLEKWFARRPVETIIATGFIASTPDNIPTTLKRDGSDFSAAIIGSLVKARQVTIWTDVDGVFSADPRKVSEAVILSTLSYQEAWEMSYFGANVLHPRTIIPVMKYNIPIVIRNIFNTSAPGTMICQQPVNENGDLDACVKAFATIDKLALVNVEGTGMAGVPGTASAIFGAVKDVGANVIMISQASSEHSVCFAVPEKEVASVSAALHARFREALAAGRLSKVEVIHNCSILAAVGLRMASTPGVSATLFDALAKANINVRAIAQGCSEYNITVVLKQEDCVRALRAAHSRFFLSKTTLAVGIVGPGLIGRTLLNQLKDQRILDFFARRRSSADCFLICTEDVEAPSAAAAAGLFRRRRRLLLPSPRPPCAAAAVPPPPRAPSAAAGHSLPPSLDVASAVRPSPPPSGRRLLRRSSPPPSGRLPYGTLSYIFNNFEGARTFSDVVAEAKEAGYTEPDPRDDLSGTDVARKVIILARESGLRLELSDIPVRSLVPEALRSCTSADEYLQKLPSFDQDWARERNDAEAAGEVLRYVGVVDVVNKKGQVELRRYKRDHPFAQLSGSDNIIAFTTSRYKEQPLIVRGPGAGAEVTAGGVFSDILRLASYLGAPS